MTLQNILTERSQGKCELCSASTHLSVYCVPPGTAQSADKSVLVCSQCLEQIQDSTKTLPNHWRCLSDSMWSEHPAVQVMAWRLLKQLTDQDWAQDLLGQLYLDEETLKWAEAGNEAKSPQSESDDVVVKDNFGNALVDGDSVTLIKDLEVKGANFTAKRGTVVKNISLTANPAHVEGRVNGSLIVLLTCFLKKAT